MLRWDRAIKFMDESIHGTFWREGLKARIMRNFKRGLVTIVAVGTIVQFMQAQDRAKRDDGPDKALTALEQAFGDYKKASAETSAAIRKYKDSIYGRCAQAITELAYKKIHLAEDAIRKSDYDTAIKYAREVEKIGKEIRDKDIEELGAGCARSFEKTKAAVAALGKH